MLEAIRLSRYGMESQEGGPFGCVIVQNNQIVGHGNNHVTSSNDPTAHAEITAIRDACSKLKTYELLECELYSSCEPCPMCLGAIYWAGIKKIYFACSRQDADAIGYSDDFIYQEVPKDPRLRSIPGEQSMRDEALEVFKDWMKNPDRIVY